MSDITIKKTPWWKMIAVKRSVKKFNKKHGNQSHTDEEWNEILKEELKHDRR